MTERWCETQEVRTLSCDDWGTLSPAKPTKALRLRWNAQTLAGDNWKVSCDQQNPLKRGRLGWMAEIMQTLTGADQEVSCDQQNQFKRGRLGWMAGIVQTLAGNDQEVSRHQQNPHGSERMQMEGHSCADSHLGWQSDDKMYSLCHQITSNVICMPTQCNHYYTLFNREDGIFTRELKHDIATNLIQ